MKNYLIDEENEGCGSVSQNPEKSPHQEILEDQGEIFSCGGVYLGNCFELPKGAAKTDFVHLPNHHKGVMVYQGGKLQRRSVLELNGATLPVEDRTSAGDTIRRFFKDSLN